MKNGWVNEMFVNRAENGKSRHLINDLKNHLELFFDYFHMSLDTFNYILEKVNSELTKQQLLSWDIPVSAFGCNTARSINKHFYCLPNFILTMFTIC